MKLSVAQKMSLLAGIALLGIALLTGNRAATAAKHSATPLKATSPRVALSKTGAKTPPTEASFVRF